MIVKRKKFQTIVITKKNLQNNPFSLSINNMAIKPEDPMELLGVTIDDKLAFEKHINKLGRSGSCQLNAISRCKSYLSIQAKKVLTESFVYSNFDYCPLVWHFCQAKSLQKINKNIKKRALHYLYDDFESSYSELLQRSNKTTMTTQRLRSLCTEIYKTLNQLNP